MTADLVGGLMLFLAGAGAAFLALLVVQDRHDHRRVTAPRPVYGNCPVHHSVHEMLAHGRMCDGWEPAP